MVNAVWPVLCFKAYSMLYIIHRTAFAFVLLYPVACINLQSCHCSPAFHDTPVGLQSGGMTQLLRRVSCTKTPVVINTSTGNEEWVVYSITNTNRFAPIHRCILHIGNLASRTSSLVKWSVLIGIDLQYMVVNTATCFASQIEISMVSHRHKSRGVGLGFVVNNQSVIFCGSIGHPHIHITRITFFAIFAAIM